MLTNSHGYLQTDYPTSTVGGVHSDRIREIAGHTTSTYYGGIVAGTGACYVGDYGYGAPYGNTSAGSGFYGSACVKASRTVPTSTYSAPRAFGILAVAYLGS